MGKCATVVTRVSSRREQVERAEQVEQAEVVEQVGSGWVCWRAGLQPRSCGRRWLSVVGCTSVTASCRRRW